MQDAWVSQIADLAKPTSKLPMARRVGDGLEWRSRGRTVSGLMG